VIEVVSVNVGDVPPEEDPANPFAVATETPVIPPLLLGGTAHVPSPRQKVDEDAAVPLPKLATGRLPVAWLTGMFVQLERFPDVGVPKMGVTNVGVVASTLAPDPVEVVAPVPPLAIGSAPTACDTGTLVALVNTTEDGVPSAGVTKEGDVERTTLPVPVEVVTPVPPFPTATMPVTFPAVPVVFWLNVGHVNVPVLKFPDCGVPSIGVTSVGDVERTVDPEPVEVVTPVPPLATGNVPLT
jgi:hypothetical protein